MAVKHTKYVPILAKPQNIDRRGFPDEQAKDQENV